MERCFMCGSKLNLWRVKYRHVIANIMEEIVCKSCIPEVLNIKDWKLISFEVIP